MRYAPGCVLIVIYSLVLGGCGLTTPSMQEIGQSAKQVPLDKTALIGEIKCEITRGIYEAIKNPEFGKGAKNPGNSVEWLRDWVVKANLTMTVDDKGTFGPGVTLTSPFMTAGQSVSLGIGVQASSAAQRKEEVGFTYSLGDLMKTIDHHNALAEIDPHIKKIDPLTPCRANGLFINSDLKIDEFMNQNIFLARVPGLVKGRSSPFDAFNYTVQFTIMRSGSLTPSWKLLRVSVDPSSPFASASRTRTQYLTLTFGSPPPGQEQAAQTPGQKQLGTPPLAPLRLNDTAAAMHNASLIGQAIAGAIKSATGQ